ncbi:MAG: insulinase family protein [Bacteroides sp.]|nr:insulinase family protein [Bacteroides sp.]
MSAPDRTHAPALNPPADISVTPASYIEVGAASPLTVVRSGDQPVTRLVLMWEGGSYDAVSREALAVMGECLTEGTTSLDADAVADAIDYAGARIAFRPADHYSGVSLLCLSDKLPGLLPLLSDIVTAPAFDPHAVEVARKRRATAAAVDGAKVSVRAERALRPLITGAAHPAAAFSTAEGFESVGRDDVTAAWRATLGRGRRGLHAFIGGNFTDGVLDSVDAFLRDLPRGEASASPVSIKPFAPQQARRIDVADPEALQSAVSMAIPVPGRDHPDYITLRLAVTALGGYFGSRLMSNIREKRGLTYGISARLLGAFEGAYAQIGAQCDAASVDEVIAQTRAEIESLWLAPPEGDELERMRLSAWSALAAQADTPLSTVDYYVTQLLVGTPRDYFERHLAAIRAVTGADIARVAREYLGGEWAVATCGR